MPRLLVGRQGVPVPVTNRFGETLFFPMLLAIARVVLKTYPILLNTRNNLMRTQIARLVKCMMILGLWSIIIAYTSPLRAQTDTNKTKQRLSRSLANLSRAIDEIKWANVTIYRVQDELKQRLIQP